MSTPAVESDYHDNWNPPDRRLHASAVLSAAVHMILWGSFVLALALVVPRWAKVFEDLGTELSAIASVVILLANLVARMWLFVPFGILGAAFADWWIMETLSSRQDKSLARLWFWLNVALPILLAIAVGVIIAANVGDLYMQLS